MRAEQLRAVLLAVLVVAAPIVGVGLLSSSASAAPSGFVSIPESNISSDLPSQTPMGQTAQAIADAGVMATDNASTLEVTVTSPGRAKNLFDGPVYGGGPIAIVLTDDQNAAGRTVALPAAELEDAIGYTPSLAYGTHDDGSTYRVPVTESEGGTWLLVEIPHFSTNSITFAGTSQISATPATDGATFSYDVSDKSSVGDFQINVTGYDATEWDNETANAIGSTSSTATSDTDFGNAALTDMSVSGTGSSAKVVLDSVSSRTVTFSYTGSSQTFTVSEGVSTITIETSGAGGGDGYAGQNGAGLGGSGGYVKGNLSVSGGDTFTVDVAQGGATSTEGNGAGSGGSSPFVAGADGGNGLDDGNNEPGGGGGGGGGASKVTRDGDSADIAIAEGGGGGGGGSGDDSAEDGGGGGGGARGGSGGAGGSAFNGDSAPATGSGGDGGNGGSGSSQTSGSNGGDGGQVAHGDLSAVSTTTGGGNSGNAQIIITEPAQAAATGNYTGPNHTITGPQTAYVDLTLTQVSADVTIQEWTGSSWSDVTTATYTTTGNKSIDISSASSGKIRAKVDFTNNGLDETAEINDVVFTGSGDRSVAIAGNKDPTGPSTNGKVALEVTGHADELGATPSSVDVSADTGESVSFGDLTDGQTSEKELDIQDTTSTLTFDHTGGTLDYTLKVQEVSETVDPQVEVNGNTTGGATVGTLADGTTTSLTANKDWIVEGTNQVNVSVGDGSLTADAPTPSVTLNYTHEASLSKTVSYDGEKWTERYDVSRTWGSDTLEANLTIPFNDNAVVEIRGIETKTNSGSWSSVSSSSYSLDGTTLTVDLGSVDKNDETHVRANGSKVAVSNGSITVLTAAAEGTEEKTEFSIASKSSGFYIDVGGSDDDRVQYLSGETWDTPAEYSRFTSNGAQELHLPNAAASDSATIETLDSVDVQPQEGAVEVTVTDATAPKIDVDPGALDEEQVDYTYYGAETGKTVVLYSITDAIARATGIAESPVTLTDDDSAETLDFRIESSGGGSGGGGGGGVALGNPSRSIGIEQVVLALLLVAGLVGAAIIARRYAPEETDLGRRGAIVLAAAGFVAILLAVEVLQPGTISNAIASSLEPILSFAGILAVIGAAVVGGLAIREWWRRRQEEREGEPVTLRLQR